MVSKSPDPVKMDSPLLTGGVTLDENVRKSRIIDWVSLSCSGLYSERLFNKSEICLTKKEPYWKGFKEHQMRKGRWDELIQRHLSPEVKSARWGKTYELWVWTGGNAQFCKDTIPAEELKHDRKCTRIDCAFDIACEESLEPERLIKDWQDHCDARNITTGPDGQGCRQTWTWYVGARGSDRRIRVYRKDKENPAWAMGATMRIELELHRQESNALFWYYERDIEKMWGMAVAHIEDMTGFRISSDVGSIPETENKKPVELSSSLASLVMQYGSILEVIARNKIDIVPLLDKRLDLISKRTKMRDLKKIKDAKCIPKEIYMNEALKIIEKRL